MPKGQTRHWLLSTEKTLRHFNILGYRGKSFTWEGKDLNRHPTVESLKHIFKTVVRTVVLPNAVIAANAGKTVNLKDACDALNYIFARDSGRIRRSDTFNRMVETNGAWVDSVFTEPLNLFVLGIKRDNTVIPVAKRYTLEGYLTHKVKNGQPVVEAVKDFPEVKPGKVDALAEMLKADPEWEKLTYEQIMEKYAVGRKCYVADAIKILRGSR